LIEAPSPKGNFSAIEKKIRIKLEYFSSTKLLMPIFRMYGLKREGGELFKGVFANFLSYNEILCKKTILGIQLAKKQSSK